MTTNDRPALRLPAARAGRARLDPTAGVARRHRRAVGRRPVAARALREERRAAARPDGRPARATRFYADLERDQAERATMSMLVPPQMMNTMVPSDRRRDAGGRRRVHRGVLRRPGAQLHAPGLLRPPHRLAEPPASRRATASTSTTCGRSRGSPTATPPRCSPRCCRPARSTAATAPGWTSSATPRRSSPSSSWPASRSTATPRCSTTCTARPRCATSSSPAATWPTCRGRTSRGSSTSCSRSTTSATSGSPPRR